ncbi:MAG: hypothetical protein JO062_01770 [Bryobacterales bacterium]|nr:hypothetical protein [Bryobacterales bacterium]
MLIDSKYLRNRSWLVPLLCTLLSLSDCGSDSHPKLPVGVVDLPTANQAISGAFDAAGWAISEDRIARVSVYVDGNYLKDCTLGVSRPDVSKVFPGVPDGERAGWTTQVDTASLPPGKHELLFEVQSSKGAIRDIGAIPVEIVH